MLEQPQRCKVVTYSHTDGRTSPLDTKSHLAYWLRRDNNWLISFNYNSLSNPWSFFPRKPLTSCDSRAGRKQILTVTRSVQSRQELPFQYWQHAMCFKATMLHPLSHRNLLQLLYRFAMTVALNTAKVERSFLSVKRLLPDYKRPMIYDRLCHLTVLHIAQLIAYRSTNYCRL